MENWIKELPGLNGTCLYELPGFTDFHLHAGWTDFDHQDQQKRSREEISQRIAGCMSKLYDMGFRLIRDAGGLEEEDRKAAASKPGFSFLPCCGMVSAENAKREEFHCISQKREGSWVKLFATGGIGAAKEKVLQPAMSRETFFRLTESYHRAGKLVMVHTWGGDSLDWAIEAGADSVEHGVFMDRRQAHKLAGKGILYVPTAAVYQLIASEENPMQVPSLLAQRANYAVQQHQKAVHYAVEEGVRIGCGTDFYSDPALISYEYEELFALQAYGVPQKLAWEAFCGRTLTEKETGGPVRTEPVRLSKHPWQIHSPEELKKAVIK